MTTRATRLNHVFEVLSFTPEVQSFLRDDMGVTTAGRLASLADDVVVSLMEADECPLTQVDRTELAKFHFWYRQWASDDDASLLEDALTEDFWERFVYEPTNEADENDGGASEVTAEEGTYNRFRVRADLRQFRRFTGSTSEWTPWKRGFVATGTAQGMGTMFDPDYVPPEPDGDGYGEYRQMSALLHAALTVSTADGTAINIVDRYRTEADGIGAWRQLLEWYEGQGSRDNIANRAMHLLHSLRLNRSTTRGADGYIARFDQCLQDLDETGHTYDETMKKIVFLNGIEDESYFIIVELLRSNTEATYEDCIMEIRRRAIDIARAPAPQRRVRNVGRARPRANIRNVNRNRPQQQNRRPDDWVEDHVWAAMSREERRQKINERGQRNNNQGRRVNLPSQYGGRRSANSAQRPQVLAIDQEPANHVAHGDAVGRAMHVANGRLSNADRAGGIRRAHANVIYALRANANITEAFHTAQWERDMADPVMIVDGGADITVLGAGWIPVFYTGDFVDLVGFDSNAEAVRAPIVSAVSLAPFKDGIFRFIGCHNAAYLGDKSKTSLLSSNQARKNGIFVDDVPQALGGRQMIEMVITRDGMSVDTFTGEIWFNGDDWVTDQIPLVPQGNLMTFPLMVSRARTILHGMTDEEKLEIIPNHTIHWLTACDPLNLDEEHLHWVAFNEDAYLQEMRPVWDAQAEGGRYHPATVDQQLRIDSHERFRPDFEDPDGWRQRLVEEVPVYRMLQEGRDPEFVYDAQADEDDRNGVRRNRPYSPVDHGDVEMEEDPFADDDDDGDDDIRVVEVRAANVVRADLFFVGGELAALNHADEVNATSSQGVIGYSRTLDSLVALATRKEAVVSPVGVKGKGSIADAFTKRRGIDFAANRRKLGWLPLEIVKKTFENTTQLAKKTITRIPLRRHLKSRYPELNRRRLSETFATDTFFASERAYDGYTCMQLFVGTKSRFTGVYGMQTESQGHQALEDFIREYGAPYGMRSDNAKMEIGHAFTQICRKYNIKQSTTEPHHPQQNPAERQIQDVKRHINIIMDRTGCPDKAWYLATKYVVYLLNRTSTGALKWKTPIEVAFGETPDISNLLQFAFWELVYYHNPEESFPSTKECLGRFVGIAENVGDFMTYYILAENEQVLARSSVRSAEGTDTNKRLIGDGRNEGSMNPSDTENAIFAGNDDSARPSDDVDTGPNNEKVHSLNDIANIEAPLVQDPEEIIGFKYVGEHKGLPMSKTVTGYDPESEEFTLELGCGLDETVQYGTIIELFNKKEEEQEDQAWTYEKIVDHRRVGQGPVEVQVQWTNGETTWETVSSMRKDDPITLAQYARENSLIGKDGWKWAKSYQTNPSKMIRMVRRVLKSTTKRKKQGPKYKFGVKVPRSVTEAYELDKANGNTMWAEAIQKEVDGLNEFDTFEPLEEGVKAPEGFTFVPLLWTFDCKFDGRRKGRLVCSGNWTEPLDTDAYSGVVSIDTIRLAFLLGELNGLTAIATDISSAYLHGYTKEKVYTKAGPEFGELNGRLLLVRKAIYGLRGSSFAWHEVLADTLRSFGWTPSYADADLWIKDCGTHYEYLATWVDDILHWSRDPTKLIKQLETKFSLKGTGAPEYYLGGDIEQIKWDGVESGTAVALSARTYITNVCEKIEKLFEMELRHYGSPLDPIYHPEIDQTSLLPELSIPKYQMLVGCANWVVTLGRFDVYFAVSTMARFNVAPREGHLKAMLRLFGYLKHTRKWRSIVDPTPPERDESKVEAHSWSDLYPEAEEELPPNMPPPKGKTVSITVYKDADGGSDLVTRRSVTGILVLANSFPVKYFSKRQATVETSTYGSELVAARIAVDLLVEMRYKLRMLGVPIETPSVMYGDNMSVVLNTTRPSSVLKKKHQAIAYHRVREACAAGFLSFSYIPSKENISDCLTKALSPMQYRALVKPFFTRGARRKQGECQDHE